MNILLTGLALGLMGSFHCAGMCGPIALSLPLRGQSRIKKVTGGILYNLGRTLTYAIMGAIFGLVGQGFQLAGYQQWISIAMGSFMIIAITIPFLPIKLNIKSGDFLTGKLRVALQKLFQKQSFKGLFFIGVLNGFLPCGLVYMAIAGAIGTANLFYGIAFMVLFGLGTLPMLLGISILGNLISIPIRNKINKAIPYMVVVVGIIFILRGLSLGIPFLSPPAEKLKPGVHMKMNEKTIQSEAISGSCCHADN